MNFNAIHPVVVTLSLIMALPVSAHDDDPLFNVVNLQAEAEREIPNDQMIVTLVTEHDGKSASAVATEINKDMEWALSVVKQHSFVESKTRSYQTWPIYNDKQTIIGWRASQELELKSENIEGLSELAGKLQERLQVRQMSFTPTDTTRKKYENELIEEAMLAFKGRVEIVSRHMDNKNHRIVNININTGSYFPPVFHERAMMKSMAMDAAPAPAVDAGTSKITVTVNGAVQFF